MRKKLSVASVATKKTLQEFMLLKTTLEQYHDVDWHVSTDSVAHKELSKFSNITSLELVKTDDCSHGTNDPIKNRLFLELVMTKFDALESAIDKNGYGLFLDSDIFFTNPIEDRVIQLFENSHIDAVLSPHMTNNLGLEAQVGHFNVGFFSIRNKMMLKMHKEMSWQHKELGMYYEQQPIQFCSYTFLTVNLPIKYNIGWWRFNEPHTKNRLNLLMSDGERLKFAGEDAVCFHVHTLKDLDYTNFGIFLLEKVVDLMKKCSNSKYDEIIRIIEQRQK
jgi:lipopolysaccharide biosynthesis glycosyltransferase